MQNILPGKYQHYKGKMYEVLGTALHTETLEEMVVYRALYESKDFGADQMWVRPKAMFVEAVNYEGESVTRFKRVEG
jgi:hypothetical protein